MSDETFFDNGIRYASGGRFSTADIWRHPDTAVPTWEFIYMLKGQAFLYVGNERYTISEGAVTLFPPNIRHGGWKPSPGPVSFFWLHFSIDPAREQTVSALPRYRDFPDGTQLSVLCRQLLHFSVVREYPHAMSDAFMSMILTEYAVRLKKPEIQKESRLVSDVADWIRENCDRPLTARMVAEHFLYHEDYLSRLFRQKLGKTLKQYIDEIRMGRLRQLLLTTDEPLKSIALRTGFDDYKAFLKYFTYHESVTPTKLREQYYRMHQNHR